MNIIETIKSKIPLDKYVEEKTGLTWRQIGLWKTLDECPFCSGRDCARLSPDGNFYCFQCYILANNSIVFRSFFDKISYKSAIDLFCQELKIQKYDPAEVDWVLMREGATEIMKDMLFSSQTKYNFRGHQYTPLEYLTEYRKHSIDAIVTFRLGFNDGTLLEKLKNYYTEDTIKASGIAIIPSNCFVYPFIVDGEVKFFRIKDPNKIKKFQMPVASRPKSSVWFNQDCLKEGKEIFIVEGEDDVVSLWDCGIDAVACCGTLQVSQVNYLKTFNLSCVYSCFDNDPTGKRDTALISQHYENTNLFIIKIPKGQDIKDIDDLIKLEEKKEDLINELKATAEAPDPETKSLIRQKGDGYYILKSKSELKLTNWTLTLDAVIFSALTEDIVRKVKIHSDNGYERELYIPSEALANVNTLRKFLYSKCDKILLFNGTDTDLSGLMEYWGIVYQPKVVIETDHIGEIEQGFISGNVFVSKNDEYKPLINGFLSLDDKTSIRIIEIVKRGGGSAGLPHFPLIEPTGGIKNFKDMVFDLMIKNRNLKVALGIGWLKACLWSGWFYKQKRFFPIFNLHGKFQGGKSNLAYWYSSILGLRDCAAKRLSDKSTSEVSLSRQFAYYSSMPVIIDDYRNNEWSERFHDFFRGIFDRTSSTKGIKEDFGIRQVPVRGCLLLTGENIPPDPALQSRMVSVEITKDERSERYYKDLVKLEPQFSCVGLDWIKGRSAGFDEFMRLDNDLEGILRKEMGSPREASVLAVILAGCLTEPYFIKIKDKLIDFAVNLGKEEMKERKKDETVAELWEAIDIINKRKTIEENIFYKDWATKELYIHIPGLLAEIKGNPFTRHYDMPNHRELVKLLKQETYVVGYEVKRIMGKVGGRWVIDLKKSPEVLRNMCLDESEEDEKKKEELPDEPPF